MILTLLRLRRDWEIIYVKYHASHIETCIIMLSCCSASRFLWIINRTSNKQGKWIIYCLCYSSPFLVCAPWRSLCCVYIVKVKLQSVFFLFKFLGNLNWTIKALKISLHEFSITIFVYLRNKITQSHKLVRMILFFFFSSHRFKKKKKR